MLNRNFRKLFIAAQVSLTFNVIVLASVALNLEWVQSHAAGGRFTDFPIEIRIGYFVQTLFMLSFMYLLWKYQDKPLTSRASNLAKVIGYLFVISIVLQLISPTPSERWNAIPASIIAVTFLVLSRREQDPQVK